MSHYEKFHEAIAKWPLTLSATLLVELRLAARAYDIGAASVVGIGMQMAVEEVAMCILDDKRHGAIHDEVEIGEGGALLKEAKPIYMYEAIADTEGYQVTGTRMLRESPLMYLYTADEDERMKFWTVIVTGLLMDAGVSTIEQCERIAVSSLQKARRQFAIDRKI